jgi:hypothetical protein
VVGHLLRGEVVEDLADLEEGAEQNLDKTHTHPVIKNHRNVL